MNEDSPHIVHSPAADRMRRHRERRRLGLRSIMIELRETEIDGLIRRGILNPDMRNVPYAIAKALHTFLDRSLGRTL